MFKMATQENKPLKTTGNKLKGTQNNTNFNTCSYDAWRIHKKIPTPKPEVGEN